MTVQVRVDLTTNDAVDMQASLLDTFIFSEALEDGRMKYLQRSCAILSFSRNRRRIWPDGIYWEGTEEDGPLTGEGAMHFQSGPT